MRSTLLMLIVMVSSMGMVQAATIKIATIAPESSSLTQAFRKADKELRKITNNEIKIKVYPGGVMGNDAVILRKMRAGQLHGSTFTAGGISTVYSDFQILSLPMLFENYKEVDAVKSKIEPILVKNLEGKGYYSFGLLESGFAYMMSDTKVSSIQDLTTKKVWIPQGDPISKVAFEEAGIKPIPLSMTDIMTALQTGLLDTITVSPIGAIVMQWFTKIKYMITTPLLYTYGTFAFSEQGWKRVPAKWQETVKKVISEKLKESNISIRSDNQKSIETLQKNGVTMVTQTPEEIQKMRNITQRSVIQLMKESSVDPALIDMIKDAVQKERKHVAAQ